MISCFHNLKDDRIYWKEALSLKKAGYEICHIVVGKENAEHVSAEGIRLIQIKKRKKFSKRFFNALYTKIFFGSSVEYLLFELAKNEKADVYHLHDWPLNKIAKKLRQLPHHPKLVNDIHDANAELIRSGIKNLKLPGKIYRYLLSFYVEWLEKKCAPHFNTLICAEEYVAAKFARFNKNIICLHNYSFFNPDDFHLPANKLEFDLIYAGGITNERGIFEIIEAVKIIKALGKNIKALIIGFINDPKLQAQITHAIKKNNLDKNIILHDAVTFEMIHGYYLKSKIGLCIFHPNKKYLNNIPIKLFEYMAFGLPVVSTKYGVVADYLKKADAGLLVDPLSPADIAKAIIYLLDNAETYKYYSANGIQAVKEKYNWKKEEEILLNCYKSLLPE